MSILNNFESKGIIDKEKKADKQSTISKFKTQRKAQEDKVKQALRNEIQKEDDSIDPYSKEKKPISQTKVMSLSNMGYQTTLLEKILQAQSNPDLVRSNIQFQQKTIDLLSEMKDLLASVAKAKTPKAAEEKMEELKNRDISSLARNIAEMSVSGVLKDLNSSLVNGVDKYGVVSILGTVKGFLKTSIDSGMLGDILKDSMTDAALSVFGAKNKAMIKAFKEDPMQTIQDGINSMALSGNPTLRKFLSPHFKGIKLDPKMKANTKDVNAQAVFDVRTHTTINTVIPDLLSRLVAQSEKTERVKYDHEKGTYLTVSQILEKYSSTDTASKYTGDVINQIRDYIEASASKKLDGRANRAIVKDKDGRAKLNSNNKIMLDDDQSLIEVLKEFATSEASLLDLKNSDAPALVKRFGLDKNAKNGRALEVVKIIQDALNSMNHEEIISQSRQLEKRKSALNSISEFDLMTSDISKKEYEAYLNRKEGRMSTSDSIRDMYGSVDITGKIKPGSRNSRHIKFKSNLNAVDKAALAQKNYKELDPENPQYGTIERQRQGYNESSRGYSATPEEIRQINLSELHNKKLISDKEYKRLLDNDSDEKLKSKVDLQNKKLAAAYALFAKFSQGGATAMDMAKMTGEPIGRWESLGYFSSVTDVLPLIKDDGSIDMAKMESRNSKFNKAYIADLDKKIQQDSHSKFDFDLTNPMESAGEVLNHIFTDPSLTKKLGIGGGTAAGLAIGKLINNHTFVKSPKLGYLLGAVGAGIMSMERTQNYLSQTLGPAGADGDGGYSNREILMAKMLNKWLPSIGLGGKTAQFTYRFLSKMGPAGKILGPIGSLLAGGTVALLTPSLIKVAKKKLFDDDGKGNKGVLKSIGKALRGIPGVNEMFGGSKDTRRDDQVLGDTISQTIRTTDTRIKELEGIEKRSPAEDEELKSLIEYRSGLISASERMKSISRTEDKTTRDQELERFNKDYLSKDEKVNQQYQADLIKRDRRNTLGDASDAKITIKSKDELASSLAKRRLNKFKGIDKSKLNPQELKEYELLQSIADGASITDVFKANMKSYLEQEGVGIDDLAEAIYAGDNFSSVLGYSNVKTGWTDEKGNFHKPLMQLSSKEEFDSWKAALPEDKQEYLSKYINQRKELYSIKDHLRDIAGLSVDSTIPGLGPREREVAIEKAIQAGMIGTDSIGNYLSNKYKMKKKDIMNKVMYLFNTGGVDSDQLNEDSMFMDKLESLTSGGKGTTDVNSLIKMRDLKGYKFKNGSKLSVAGCSIVAFNNALNFLGIGGISIDYLLEIANQYLSTDGGVTSDFMKDSAQRINLIFKTFNSIDNSFDNEMLAKFKPTSTKAVILLLKNKTGIGSHYVNLRTINSSKAIIDDPETNGTTDISTSTLVASLLEVITLEKKGSSKPTESSTMSEGLSTTISSKPTFNAVTSAISNAVNKPSDAKSFAMGGIAPGGKGNDDGIVNVRIVEDYTLPLKMTDAGAAMTLSRKLRANANGAVATEYIKKTEELRKQQSMAKEFAEQQKMQDDISRTADAIEGSSTGKGGAGTAETSKEYNKSEGGWMKRIGQAGISILSLLGLAPAGLALSKLKDSLGNLFTSKDTALYDEDGNRQEGHSSNKAGHFSRTRQWASLSKNLIKTGSSVIKGGLNISKKIGAFSGGFVKSGLEIGKKFGSKKAAAILDAGDKIKDISTKMGPFFKDLPGSIKGLLGKVFDKVPVVGPQAKDFMGSSKGKKLWGKIDDFITKFGAKFTSKFPMFAKKGAKKSSRLIPGLGLAITIGAAAWNFYDGFSKADLWANKPMDQLGFGTRMFIGFANMLWNELPNFIASLLAVIPVIGTAAAIAVQLASIIFSDMFGDFEGFLKYLGIREELTGEEEETGEYLEDKLKSKDENGNNNVTIAKGVTAHQDKSKAKEADKDGKYKFTNDKVKNDNANDIYGLMKKHGKKYGVNTSVAMAQWATESAWGTSGTAATKEAKEANALFGVKKGSDWKGKTVSLATTEYVTEAEYEKYWKAKGFKKIGTGPNGKIKISGYDEFRAYDSKDAAVEDYMKLKAEHYSNGLDGYATDPQYAQNIAELVSTNFNTSDQFMDEMGGNGTSLAMGDGFVEPIGNASDRVITSAFGPRWSNRAQKMKMHEGIDFRASVGEAIKAIKDGVVIHSGPYGGGAGNTVRIKHADGTISEYMHMDSISVKKGTTVKAGDVLGKAGATGGDYLPHLHLGIRSANNVPMDPLTILGLNPNKLKRESSPENSRWLANNAEYVSNYKAKVHEVGDMKLAAKDNVKAEEKGGTESDLPVNRSNNSVYSSPKNTSVERLVDMYEQKFKAIEQQNTMLLGALENMTKLLGSIAKNTDLNQNNIMKEAMGLTY